MTDAELVDYYVNLLILQYQNKPNAKATVSLFVTEAICNQIIYQVLNAFDIDTAVNNQLTILGKYVNAPREITGLNLGMTFFAMPSYLDVNPDVYAGFYVYTNTDAQVTSFFEQYPDLNTVYTLNDNDLRSLIQLKAEVNSSDCSMESIDNILNEFFGATCLATDNGDMTLTYAFTDAVGNLPGIVAAIGALPKPAGITVSYEGV